MNYSVLGISFVAALLLVGCNAQQKDDRITKQFLLSQGFVQSKTEPELYTLEHIQLKEAARRLGFSTSQLWRGTNNPPDSDYRGVTVRDYNMNVISESKDASGRVISLDRPETVCSIKVRLLPQWRTDWKPPQIGPVLRINSVVKPQDRTQPLQISFEMGLKGSIPWKAEQEFFIINISSEDKVDAFVGRAIFPPDAPKRISMLPNKPLTFSVTTLTNESAPGIWSDLQPGTYTLRVLLERWKHDATSSAGYQLGIP